jgi:enterochelin esterase-like enzyme
MGMSWFALALLLGQEPSGGPRLEPCADIEVPACQLPSDLTASEIEARLADGDHAFWAEGDVFHVVARRSERPTLCCSIQTPMNPVEGTPDLWSLAIRMPDLDRAMLDVWLLPAAAGAPDEWRGPGAPPPPAEQELGEGELVQHVMQSTALGQRRGLFIYRPPGDGPMPAIYLADGESVPSFASVLKPLIEAGEVPPTMIVGLWSGPLLEDGEESDSNRRHKEYLAGWDDEVYLAHERFLLSEVMPLAEGLGASKAPSDRILAGFSDGAAWALNTAMVNPDVFRGVIAMSFSSRPDRRARGSGYGSIYLTAGVYESDFHQSTVDAAAALQGSADAVRLDVGFAGHSQMLWRERFPHAVRWLLGGRSDTAQ